MNERDIKRGYQLTRGGSNREHASPTLCLRKNGGTAGGENREGLGWPPQELTLLFILPEHQSTTIPPFLHKSRGQKEKLKKTTWKKEISNVAASSQGEAQVENKLPKPMPSQKGGNYMGWWSRRTRVATPGTHTTFFPSWTPIHSNPTFSL